MPSALADGKERHVCTYLKLLVGPTSLITNTAGEKMEPGIGDESQFRSIESSSTPRVSFLHTAGVFFIKGKLY